MITTRWCSATRTFKFLVNNRLAIHNLTRSKPRVNMSATWWEMLFLVDEASQEIAKTFERLQGKQLLIQQQKGHLNSLIKSLLTRFFINQVKPT